MTRARTRSRVVPWCCAIIGGAITVYGLHGLIGALHGIGSRQFLKWFVGADLAHDLVVAPAACLVGVALSRLVPPPAHAPVRAGFFATAIVLAIGWAPHHGSGHAAAPGNSSDEPLDYATADATTILAVWTLAAVWLTVTIVVRRHGRQPRARPPSVASRTPAR